MFWKMLSFFVMTYPSF